MIVDRSYQTEAVRCVWDYFEHNFGNPIVAMPTGTGKSVVIARFIESVLREYPRQKIMVITHVKELIEQNYEKFCSLWPGAPAGIYSSGLGQRDVMSRVIFAGVASVAKRPGEFGHVDLVLIDECHLLSPSETTMYQSFIRFLTTVNPYLKVIGFTATPWRLGQGSIIQEDSIFTDICFDITNMWAFNRLIAEGYLAPLVPKTTRTVLELDGVHIRGGDYIPGEMQKAVDRDHITRAALNEAMEYSETRHSWLIFASGIEHAEHIHEILQEFGVPGGIIHSKIDPDTRRTNIEKHKSGEFTYLVNNNVLTTGFDNPRIDLILCLRPTLSTVLWVQMLGRGTRPFPGKNNCLVLDFAGNTRKLGPINDPVIPRKKGEKGGSAPVRKCEKCGALVHASLRICGAPIEGTDQFCDQEFTFETKLNLEASSTALIKGDLPIVEPFRVDHITYKKHVKMGKPDSMCVTYYCGLKQFKEFVCLEHGGTISHKAKQWVKERLEVSVDKVDALLLLADQIKPTTHIRVWINQKYPTIMSHCFDGTNFGKEESDGSKPSQEMVDNMAGPGAPKPEPNMDYDSFDDDIPF